MEISTDTCSEKPKPRALAKSSFYGALILLILSLLVSLALKLNKDISLDEAIGPHRIIGSIAFYLLPILMFIALVYFIAAIICTVLAPFRKPRLTNLVIAMAGLLFAMLAHSVSFLTFNRVRGSPNRSYIRSLKYIGKDIEEYAEKHNGQLPPAENWCDCLIKLNPYVSRSLRYKVWENPEGLSQYGLNKNAGNAKLEEIPGDMVLLFETSLAKNPAGNSELMTTENHKGTGCFVLFGDMHIEFVKAKDFNNLKWGP